ncbi:MAG: hypothetical protein AAFR23_01065, partial [Pseudomonadota bacterium]
PLALEAAAERATRALGHDQTIGTSWGGAGSFIELLRADLPDDVRLSAQNPPVLYDQSRVQQSPARAAITDEAASSASPSEPAPAIEEPISAPVESPASSSQMEQDTGAAPQSSALAAENIQRSIARIHDASQAPPLSPPDYRILFEEMANEISENDLQGVQTITNVASRIERRGSSVPKDSIRFALDVVGGPDPWFEQGATTDLFSGRFRNFVVQRCRSQGLTLSRDELDLIDAWFAGNAAPRQPAASEAPVAAAEQTADPSNKGAWFDDAPADIAGVRQAIADDMPRLFRNPGRTT